MASIPSYWEGKLGETVTVRQRLPLSQTLHVMALTGQDLIGIIGKQNTF